MQKTLPLTMYALCVFLVYVLAIARLESRPPAAPEPELVATLPLAAQVIFAGGDRYLAANLSGFRVLVASTLRMQAEDYAVQARLQDEIAWLNPGHEDNYYIAEAILPWAGEVETTQRILQRAAKRRVFDWTPLFYYGFGRYHFYKDPAGASEALREAVPRAGHSQDALSLQILSLAWAEKGYSTAAAAGVVSAMAETAPAGAFRNYLQQRADRLHALVTLRDAAMRYMQRFGRPPNRLDELVTSGMLPVLPKDPTGHGFALDAQGQPIFRDKSEQKK